MHDLDFRLPQKTKITVNNKDLKDLCASVLTRLKGQSRVLVAIAGPPASGKSTLAEKLAGLLGDTAVVLPMDGFHLDNATLQQKGRLHRKGAPDTFDAEGFVQLVQSLRESGPVSYPTFDRSADATVPNGGRIEAETKIVLIEGNYLLLETPPWNQLKPLFDLTIGLSVNRQELETRLVDRWLHHGLTEDQARARTNENDMKNIDFVEKNATAPDIVFR